MCRFRPMGCRILLVENCVKTIEHCSNFRHIRAECGAESSSSLSPARHQPCFIDRMKGHIIFAVFCIWATTASPPASADVPLACSSVMFDQLPVELGSCGFYRQCMEARVACGPSGYALSYGEKYCKKFSSETRLSPKGKAWRDAALICLQKSLLPIVQTEEGTQPTCEAVMDTAFDSHPLCYLDPGKGAIGIPSICDLSLVDLYLITTEVDGRDLRSLRAAKQINIVSTQCVGALSAELKNLQTAANEVEYWSNHSIQEQSYLFTSPNESDLLQKLEFWKARELNHAE